MSILNDREIQERGPALIEPFDPGHVQPASYDLTLHGEVLLALEAGWRDGGLRRPVDVRETGAPMPTSRCQVGKRFVLRARRCLIASTAERITCPRDLAARVEGKSSLGRLFVAVHVTAGWIDPGFSGQVTLEIVNHGPWDVVLWEGMKIAQVNFARLAEPCSRPYGRDLGSHYQGQVGPTAARTGRDDL